MIYFPEPVAGGLGSFSSCSGSGNIIWGNCLTQVHDSQHVQESFAMDTDVQGSFNTIQEVQERFATQEVISKTLTSIKTFNITQFQYNQSRFSS